MAPEARHRRSESCRTAHSSQRSPRVRAPGPPHQPVRITPRGSRRPSSRWASSGWWCRRRPWRWAWSAWSGWSWSWWSWSCPPLQTGLTSHAAFEPRAGFHVCAATGARLGHGFQPCRFGRRLLVLDSSR